MKSLVLKSVFVCIFGIAFGISEAVVVIYLQQILGIIGSSGISSLSSGDIFLNLRLLAFLKPEASQSIIPFPPLLSLEIVREFSTLFMLLGLAVAVGSSALERLSYFLIAFGIWDIFYYVAFRIFFQWPRTFLDQDLFFLIPVPWVGPVITPIVISLIFIILGFILIFRRPRSSL
ncbi:MAG TPA: hypothetical protein VF828_04150 [Patescibacteria group bacterium]